ncbi:MAG: hypothetical protein IPK08_15780 [Bacteroidetes bacterium]|nr:hypothetical protein [Bacteroidota bacterium]
MLVVELKKGRVTDSVAGQFQKYMGFVKEKLTVESQIVKGVIISLEDDLSIHRIDITINIEYYSYQVSFRLLKG